MSYQPLLYDATPGVEGVMPFSGDNMHVNPTDFPFPYALRYTNWMDGTNESRGYSYGIQGFGKQSTNGEWNKVNSPTEVIPLGSGVSFKSVKRSEKLFTGTSASTGLSLFHQKISQHTHGIAIGMIGDGQNSGNDFTNRAYDFGMRPENRYVNSATYRHVPYDWYHHWYHDHTHRDAQGDRYGLKNSSEWNRVARWTAPIGVQFNWSDENSNTNHPKPSYLLDLILFGVSRKHRGSYHVNLTPRMTGRNDYLVDGDDITNSAARANRRGLHTFYADDNTINVIREENFITTGIYISVRNDYQAATYNRYFNFWNFKFLYHKPGEVKHSKVILPVPHTLREAIYGRVPIASAEKFPINYPVGGYPTYQ